MNSSSGGLFNAIAVNTIKRGGVVFGVKFDTEWNVVFSYTETEEGIKAFQGSKYVQAFVGNAYKQAEHFLKTGRDVLFSGTSCQIAGLKKFLAKKYENLLTLDFICHGVPSQKLFHQFIKEELEKQTKSTNKATKGKCSALSSVNLESSIKDIKFREKGIGWKKFRFVLTLIEPLSKDKQNIVLSSLLSQTTYGEFFLTDLTLRPSCYHCSAKSGRAHSDITLADFWGVQKFYPKFDDDKGITLAIINTEKGGVSIPFHSLEFIETTVEEAFAKNGGYFKSVSPQPNRDEFWHLYKNGNNLTTIQRIMYPISFRIKIKRAIKQFLKIN